MDELEFVSLTSKDVSADVAWVYDKLGEDSPKIYIAESYAAQKAQIKKYAKSDSMEKQYNDTVRNLGLKDGIHESQIDTLRNRYGESKENTKMDKVTEVLTKYTKGAADSEQFFGSGFEMFYSLSEENNNRLHEFYDKGVFAIEYYKKECFICLNPVALRFDGQGRLGGGEKPAIEFNDGHNMFFARDVFFDSKTWKKINSGTMSLVEILNLANVEQRSVAIELAGPEVLLKESNAVIISGPTKRGNTLYEVELKMGEANSFNNGGKYKYVLLRYGCPSTDRQYASFVPEHLRDADEAMGWKHHLTKEEYLVNLKVET